MAVVGSKRCRTDVKKKWNNSSGRHQKERKYILDKNANKSLTNSDGCTIRYTQCPVGLGNKFQLLFSFLYIALTLIGNI